VEVRFDRELVCEVCALGREGMDGDGDKEGEVGGGKETGGRKD
jgi:hypothetical protein